MTLYVNSPVSKPELDPQAIDWAPVQSLATVPTLGGQTIADTSRIQPASTVVDARPSVPQDPDYFEAIVSGRAFILDDPVLRDWLDNPEIRQTATVVYGLNPQGERVDGLGLTLDTGQTVLIHREDLGHVHSGQLAAASSITPLFKQGSTGDRIQTPEGRLNSAWSQRAGVAYLPDVIDPDSAAVVAIVAELRSHGRLRPGMTEEEVFAVVQAEMARRYQYQSDGDQDRWQSAQDTLQRGRGDCEDWSIATASVLARALWVTGHSADEVTLHIGMDGDKGHMLVEYAGYTWDPQKPDLISIGEIRPVVTLGHSKILVVDPGALDRLIQVGTASGSAGKIGQQISFDARNDRSGLPLSFNELASITTNDLYALVHGDTSVFRDVANALANGAVNPDLLERFFEVQRQFDAMRSFFVLLMQCIQQRGKWIRLILAMIEGVEPSNDSSDHKYSFEGINFNQLTQSLVSLYVADIESELAADKAQAVEEHSNWWNTLENMVLGDESTIAQETKEQGAVRTAYNKVEALMRLLSEEFEEEQSELSQLFGAMLSEASFKHTADGADTELVDFGNGNTRSLSQWQKTGNEKTIGFSDAKEQADRPLFDIVESSLQTMIIRGKKLQAGIQMAAAALGFRANLQYAVQKITLGYGEFDTGVQAKVFAWRTSRYDVFESQFVDQLIKLKSLFDESAKLALDIEKKERLQVFKIAQNTFNVVVAPAILFAGLGPVFTVLGNLMFEVTEFALNYSFEEKYNKNPNLDTMGNEKLNDFLEAQGIPISKPGSVDANDQSVHSAWQAYERVRFKQGKALRLSLTGNIQDKNGNVIENVRWQTNEGSLKKLDALYDVYVSEALMESFKPMALMQQSWVQQSLLMATILQFSIGFSVSDKYASDNRAVAERVASLVDELKKAIEREWENRAKEQAIQFEREQKKRQLQIDFSIDVLKNLSGLGLATVKPLQDKIFFKVTKWAVLYQHGLGSVANALKSLAPWFPWVWSDAEGKSLSEAHQKLSANTTTLDQLRAQAKLYEKQWQTARDYRKKIESMILNTEDKHHNQKLEDARLNEARAKAQHARHQANVYLADYRNQKNNWSQNTHTNVYGQEFKMVNRKAVFEKQEAISKLFKIYYTLQAARIARYRIMDSIMGLSRGDRSAESIGLISKETDLINRHFDRLTQQATEQMTITNKKTEAATNAINAGIDLVITLGFMASLAFFQNPAMVSFLLFSKEMVGLLRSFIVNWINNNDSKVHGDTRDLSKKLIDKAPSGDSTTLISAMSPQAATQAPTTKSFENVVQMQRGKSGEYYLNYEQVMQFNRQLAYTVQAMQLSSQAAAKIAELRYMIMNRMAGGTTSPTAVTGLMMGLNEAVLQSYYAHRKAILETRASRETVANSLWQTITADSVHAGANVLSYVPVTKGLSHLSQTVKLAQFGSASLFRQLTEHNKQLVGRLNNFNTVSKSDNQHEKEAELKTQAAKKEKERLRQIQASSSRSVQGMAALYQTIKLTQYQHQYQQHRSDVRAQYLKTVQEFLGVVGSSVSKTLKEKKIRDRVLQHTPRFMAQLNQQKANPLTTISLGVANGLLLDIPRTLLASSAMANYIPLDWHIAAKNAATVPTPYPSIYKPKSREAFKKNSQAEQLNSIAELFLMASCDRQKECVNKLTKVLSEQFSIQIQAENITKIIAALAQNNIENSPLLQTLDMMQLMSQLPGDSMTYIVSEKTIPSIDKLSKLMAAKIMPEAPVYQRIASVLADALPHNNNTQNLEAQLKGFASDAEENLKKATQPKQQLAAVRQAMAVARVLGRISKFNLPGSHQTPIVYSIIRKVWAKEFRQASAPINGLPRMKRKWNRLKRLDGQTNEGDELDGVLAYLGMEKPKPILNLNTRTLDALSSDELAIALVNHATAHGWQKAGECLTNTAGTEVLKKISWKDTLVAIRRIIDYNRVTPIRFRSRQNDTNQKTSDFLVGVFGASSTGLTEFDACVNLNVENVDNVDNALAILTGLSPLNVSGTALTSTANRLNIQGYLEKLNNSDVKSAIQTRISLYKDSDKNRIQLEGPWLDYQIDLSSESLLGSDARGWPGFVNARFPSEKESESVGEDDLDLADS